MRDDQLNRTLPWCVGCPDGEACSQGGCYLDGGPVQPDETADDEGSGK